LSAGSFLRRTYLLYFSQPAANRPLFRDLRKKTVRSVVELGIGPISRTQQVLEIASWRPESPPIRYTGIDLFDARPAERPPLALKQAFANLQSTGARVQLVPGTPEIALKRVANSLAHTDLLLIDSSHSQQSLAQAWTWIPRMLTGESLVFWEQATGQGKAARWQQLSIVEIQQLAAAATKEARRAA
jgi:hypothetical protein